MNLICIKMKTGEDVIARVKETYNSDITPLSETPPRMPKGDVVLENPCVISLQEVPGGRMALALLPYLMGDHEADFAVDLHHAAVGVYKARAEIEDSYIKQTSKLDLTSTLKK